MIQERKHYSIPMKAQSPIQEEQIPFFFIELFAKAGITDSEKREMYFAKLQEAGLDSSAKIALASLEDLKELNLSIQDAEEISKVCHAMVQSS